MNKRMLSSAVVADVLVKWSGVSIPCLLVCTVLCDQFVKLTTLALKGRDAF